MVGLEVCEGVRRPRQGGGRQAEVAPGRARAGLRSEGAAYWKKEGRSGVNSHWAIEDVEEVAAAVKVLVRSMDALRIKQEATFHDLE